jgi:hypothetical protein
MVQGEMRAEGFSLSNGIDIEVMSNSFRAVRGRPILLGIFDELAYWRDENSAKPSAVAQIATTLREYRLSEVTGAWYAAEWVVSAFASCGIAC